MFNLYDISTKSVNYGFFASMFGLMSFLPIVYNIVKTKNTSNFVWMGLILVVISSFFWMMEGLRINSLSLVVNTIIYIILYFVIIFIKLRY